MMVAQSAGVGGGSLAYSSVHLEAHPVALRRRAGPREVTYAELKPYYDTVAKVLNLQTLPDGQLTERLKLARDAAATLGHADRFSKAPLAVSFSPEWHYGLDEPFDRRHSKAFTNAQGQRRAPASTSATATSAATSGRRTAWTSPISPRPSSRLPRCGRCIVVRRIEPRDARLPRRVRSDRAAGSSCAARRPPRACSWPPAASARPSSCCGRATSTRRCRTSRRRSAGAGRPMPTCSRWPDTPTATACGSPSARRSPRLIDFMDGDAARRAVRHRGRRVPEPVAERGAGLDGRARARATTRQRARPFALERARGGGPRQGRRARADALARRRRGCRRRPAAARPRAGCRRSGTTLELRLEPRTARRA